MYKCDLCKNQSKPGEPAHVVPTGYRDKVYLAQKPSRGNNWFGGREGRGVEWTGQRTVCAECLAATVGEEE